MPLFFMCGNQLIKLIKVRCKEFLGSLDEKFSIYYFECIPVSIRGSLQKNLKIEVKEVILKAQVR